MTSALHTDIGSLIAGRRGLAEATITAAAGNDNVAVTGPIIDLQSLFLPQGYASIALLVNWITTLTAAKTLSIVLAKLQHGAASNLSDAADYGNQLGPVIVATGAQTALEGTTTVNVGDLRGAKRYIRVSLTTDLSNTATDTSQAGVTVVFGGPIHTPASY